MNPTRQKERRQLAQRVTDLLLETTDQEQKEILEVKEVFQRKMKKSLEVLHIAEEQEKEKQKATILFATVGRASI